MRISILGASSLGRLAAIALLALAGHTAAASSPIRPAFRRRYQFEEDGYIAAAVVRRLSWPYRPIKLTRLIGDLLPRWLETIAAAKLGHKPGILAGAHGTGFWVQ